VPFSPLGRGYLTGKLDEDTTFDKSDIRSRNPHFTQEALKADRGVVELLERIAKQKNTLPAQIALTWLLAQRPWIVPIPGSRNLERLDENSGAVKIQLKEDDFSEIKNHDADQGGWRPVLNHVDAGWLEQISDYQYQKGD